jgi:hypothetical protein
MGVRVNVSEMGVRVNVSDHAVRTPPQDDVKQLVLRERFEIRMCQIGPVE